MKFLDNKIFYPVAALVAFALIAFSLIWPQGLGTRSPAPFGHAVEYPDYYRMTRERDARLKREAAEKAQRRAGQSTDTATATSVTSDDAPAN